MRRSQEKAMEIFYAGDKPYLQAPFKQPERWSLKFKIFIGVIFLAAVYFWLVVIEFIFFNTK